MTATAKQIGLIHVLAAKAGMDDDMRRDFLQRETGARSSKALDIRQAASVIDKLNALAGGASAKGAVAGMDSPVAGKLRALWIAGYDLGLVSDRSDRALLAFLERQTRVSHTRFLNEPGQAAAAIEALKSWLARDGKVEWPRQQAGLKEVKRAVLNAQWLRLRDIGGIEPPLFADEPLRELNWYAYRVASKQGWQYFELADYDRVQNALGRRLRAVQAKRSAAA